MHIHAHFTFHKEDTPADRGPSILIYYGMIRPRLMFSRNFDLIPTGPDLGLKLAVIEIERRSRKNLP